MARPLGIPQAKLSQLRPPVLWVASTLSKFILHGLRSEYSTIVHRPCGDFTTSSPWQCAKRDVVKYPKPRELDGSATRGPPYTCATKASRALAACFAGIWLGTVAEPAPMSASVRAGCTMTDYDC